MEAAGACQLQLEREEEERLDEAGETERWRARHADYYAGVLQQIRLHHRRE